MNNEQLHWGRVIDSREVGREGGPRHLIVSVTAPRPQEPQDDAAENPPRPPLDLALVIDTSGSMSGAPLEAARSAASGVVEQLTPRDRLSVVTFGSRVHVRADNVRCDAAGRLQLLAAVAGLRARGTTNLGGGWFEGCERVAAHGDDPARQRRVVVLSDGKANRGLTDPAELAHHAAALRDRGVFTSAVGIGDHYHPRQLEALAEHGGGRLHDAPLGADIVAVVLGELGEITGTVADDLLLEIFIDAPHVPRILGPYATEAIDGGLRVHLGTLVAGATRQVVVQADLPAHRMLTIREQARRRPVAGALTLIPWWRSTDGTRHEGSPLRARFHHADTPTAIEPGVGRQVARTWAEHLKMSSLLQNSDGERAQARRLVLEALPDFRAYCALVPGTGDLVRDLERHAERMRRVLDGRRLRDDVIAMKMSLKTERDFRAR